MNETPEHKKSNPIETAFMLLAITLVCIVFFPFALAYIIKDISLRFQFRKAFINQGKFVLFVYSDSPNWKSHIESNVLPRIQDDAIILNWSGRSQWDKESWSVQAFEHWGGRTDFNPLAVVFCGLTKVQVIRFYQAFRDFKHGKETSLQEAESQLFGLVEAKTRVHVSANTA